MNSNGSQLTKQQVKVFIETMTDDMHNTTQHKIAETLLAKFEECECLANALRAYEHLQHEPEPIPYAWAIEWESSEPTLSMTRPNMKSWVMKNAVAVKELYTKE